MRISTLRRSLQGRLYVYRPRQGCATGDANRGYRFPSARTAALQNWQNYAAEAESDTGNSTAHSQREKRTPY